MIAGLFDTHAHLDDERFDEDRDEVIERARSVGVQRILTVDSEPHRVGVSSALAAAYPGIYAASGLHPHEAAKVDDEALEAVWKQVSETPRVQAVGEIGLDYYYMHSPRDRQIRVFREMLHLALEAQRPVVVHVRDAHEDAIRILSETDMGRVGGVIHCFSGGPDEAQAYLDMGLHISISGVVTYKKAEVLREVAASLPGDRLLVETDSPYLGPGDRRGRRCEPAYVAFTAERLAELREVPPQTLARRTRENGLSLFGIRPVVQAVGPLLHRDGDRLYVRVTGQSRLGGPCRDMAPWGLDSPGFDQGRTIGLAREPLLADLLEAIEDISLAGVGQVILTGGEPTLRWEFLERLVESLRRRGATRIGLETDGLSGLAGQNRILDRIPDLFDELSVCLPAADGTTYAKLCPGPFARRGFDEALVVLRRMRKQGLTLRIVCPRDARAQVPACRRLASREGVLFAYPSQSGLR